MKQVFFWDCKAIQQGEKLTGVFSTRVAPNTPGARHDVGENQAGIKWDNWYRDATAIRGNLRWIDVVLPNYTGAQAQVVMFFENEKAVHRIGIKYDAGNCHQIINALWGVGKDLPNYFFHSVGFEVYPKKIDGKIKLNEKGGTVYNRHLSFADITPKFTYEKWKDFEQEKGLMWVKVRKAGGKEEWDTSAALKFWDTQILSIQRLLLKAETALPFTYGSILVTGVENPSGGGNLEAHEIAECQRIYERIRGEYKMPFGRTEIDADSVIDDYAPPVRPAVDTISKDDYEPYAPNQNDSLPDDLPF